MSAGSENHSQRQSHRAKKYSRKSLLGSQIQHHGGKQLIAAEMEERNPREPNLLRACQERAKRRRHVTPTESEDTELLHKSV